MRIFRAATPLFLFPFLLTPIVAQSNSTSSAPMEGDPQPSLILERAFVALTGGRAVIDETLTGTAVRAAGSENETGAVILKATSAGDSRVEANFPSGQRIEVRNHAAPTTSNSLPPGVQPGDLPRGMPAMTQTTPRPAGVWTEPNGSRHGLASHNAMTEPTWFSPALTISRLHSDPGVAISYVGEEIRDGHSVIHLSASSEPSVATSPILGFLRHLTQVELFLDSATYLPRAIAFSTHPETNAAVDIPNEIQFSDYHSVNGVQVPFHVSRFINNSLVTEIRIDSVSLNSGLASTAFAVQQ